MTPAEWMERYQSWETNRAQLWMMEGEGDYPAPQSWHDSDDEGVALTEAAHELIRGLA